MNGYRLLAAEMFVQAARDLRNRSTDEETRLSALYWLAFCGADYLAELDCSDLNPMDLIRKAGSRAHAKRGRNSRIPAG